MPPQGEEAQVRTAGIKTHAPAGRGIDANEDTQKKDRVKKCTHTHSDTHTHIHTLTHPCTHTHKHIHTHTHTHSWNHIPGPLERPPYYGSRLGLAIHLGKQSPIGKTQVLQKKATSNPIKGKT